MDDYDYDFGVRVKFVRSNERSDIRRIRYQLLEIAEREATYLFRLARRMREHNCNPENIRKVREEARQLHMMGYPENLIADSYWEYAFKI